MSSPTRAAPQAALTTPFVPPSSCADQFVTTSVYSSYTSSYSQGDTTSWTSGKTLVTILASGPADPRFSSCQPPGWNSDPSSSFQFSPAVCPSGWTAYSLGGTASSNSLVRPTAEGQKVSAWTEFTTAYCCSSGFTFNSALYEPYLDRAIEGISPTACFATVGDGPGPASTGDLTLRAHNAWHISWSDADLSTLSPSPPTFETCGNTAMIESWVPGTTATPKYGGCGPSEAEDGGPFSPIGSFIAVIVVPIVVFLLIILACAVWWKRDKRRRQRRQATRGTILGMESESQSEHLGQQPK